MPEIANNGALLVDPYDINAIYEAMVEISMNSKLKNQLIKKGINNSKTFRGENVLLRLFIYIKKLHEGK
jgi:hypothetical protein